MNLEVSTPKETSQDLAIKELKITGVKGSKEYPRAFPFNSSFATEEPFPSLQWGRGNLIPHFHFLCFQSNLKHLSLYLRLSPQFSPFTLHWPCSFLLLVSRRCLKNMNWSSSLWNWQHLCIASLGSLLETSVVSNQVQAKQNTGRTEREAYQNHGTPPSYATVR